MITYNVCFDSYQLEPYSGKWYKCNFNKEFISENDIKNIIDDYTFDILDCIIAPAHIGQGSNVT